MIETIVLTNTMIRIVATILFAKSDVFIIPLFFIIYLHVQYHFLSLNMLNNDLIAAPTPSREKINNNHGEVPKIPSKYLPNITPINTDAAIVTPICEKLAKARKVSLFLVFLSLFGSLLKIASSNFKKMVL